MINACVSNMNILAITGISLLLFGNNIIQVKGMLEICCSCSHCFLSKRPYKLSKIGYGYRDRLTSWLVCES